VNKNIEVHIRKQFNKTYINHEIHGNDILLPVFLQNEAPTETPQTAVLLHIQYYRRFQNSSAVASTHRVGHRCPTELETGGLVEVQLENYSRSIRLREFLKTVG
jgi:hypothetical protein